MVQYLKLNYFYICSNKIVCLHKTFEINQWKPTEKYS